MQQTFKYFYAIYIFPQAIRAFLQILLFCAPLLQLWFIWPLTSGIKNIEFWKRERRWPICKLLILLGTITSHIYIFRSHDFLEMWRENKHKTHKKHIPQTQTLEMSVFFKLISLFHKVRSKISYLILLFCAAH